jgi:hypothetical protein
VVASETVIVIVSGQTATRVVVGAEDTAGRAVVTGKSTTSVVRVVTAGNATSGVGVESVRGLALGRCVGHGAKSQHGS